MQEDETPQLLGLTITKGEAGSKGGNFEPGKESLPAEMGMSKVIWIYVGAVVIDISLHRLLAVPKGKDLG